MDPLNARGTTLASSPYRRARGFLSGLESVFVSISAIMVLIMSLYVASGIVIRSLFNGQLYDEIAIIGELMVMSLSLSFAFVAADRGFVAVEVLVARTGRGFKIWLDVLASLVGLVALIPITISAWNASFRAWESGSYHFGILNLPEWPGNFVYLIGFAVFMIRLADLAIHDLLCATGVIEDHDPARAAP